MILPNEGLFWGSSSQHSVIRSCHLLLQPSRETSGRNGGDCPAITFLITSKFKIKLSKIALFQNRHMLPPPAFTKDVTFDIK